MLIEDESQIILIQEAPLRFSDLRTFSRLVNLNSLSRVTSLSRVVRTYLCNVLLDGNINNLWLWIVDYIDECDRTMLFHVLRMHTDGVFWRCLIRARNIYSRAFHRLWID